MHLDKMFVKMSQRTQSVSLPEACTISVSKRFCFVLHNDMSELSFAQITEVFGWSLSLFRNSIEYFGPRSCILACIFVCVRFFFFFSWLFQQLHVPFWGTLRENALQIYFSYFLATVCLLSFRDSWRSIH